MLSRRQLAAVAGSGLGAGALSALGIGSVEGQTAAGTVGTQGSPVNLEANDVTVQGTQTGVVQATRARMSSNQSLPQSSVVQVAFDKTDYQDGNFSTSNNDYTVPKDGVYMINFHAQFSGGNFSATRQLRIGLNGNPKPSGAGNTKLFRHQGDSLSNITLLDSGDEIEFFVQTTSSSDVLESGTDSFDTFAEIVFVGSL
jgi:hypothetical protein